MSPDKWKTAVTHIAPNEIRLRGYPVEELMGRCSYAEAAWLAVKGELPTAEQGRMLDAILVSSVDHGVTPPSCLAAITAASTGAPVNAALAAGILSINRHHGGAVENCMRTIREAVALKDEKDVTADEAAAELVADRLGQKKRLAGFGHRFHTRDPRAVRLFELADDTGVGGTYTEMTRALEAQLTVQSGKDLPLNVDGAIGAVLLELGFEPEIANAFFIMARLPGLLAHVLEEWERQKP
ncbi:MAG: citryl-CoA lyase, partial [Candidatus Coatesbacteria bacterium]